MEVLVLDKNLQAITILDSFQSLIWTDRYCDCGNFEIYTKVDPLFLNALQKKYYLWSSESDHVMIIDTRQITSDVEDGNKLIVTGKSLESILKKRIVWTQTVLRGNLQNGIKQLLNENAISPIDTTRKINRLVFEDSTDPIVTTLTIDAQFTGDSLFDAVQSLCEEKKIGFKITLSSTNQFVFKLYAGVDRSYDQIANPYVIFSPKFDNILNSNYLDSDATLKTVTLVAGEGEGINRKTTSVSIDSGAGLDLDRCELYTDARDVSSKVEDTVGILSLDTANWESGSYSNTTGAKIADGSSIRLIELLSVQPSTTYNFQLISTDQAFVARSFNQSKVFVADWSVVCYPSRQSVQITTGETEYYLAIAVYTDAAKPQKTSAELLQMMQAGTLSPFIGLREKTLTDAEYVAQLAQRGSEKLAENIATQSFEGQVDASRMFKYGTDFFIGDIIQIVNEYGMEAKSRVTEIVHSQSTTEAGTFPTFSSVED